MIGDVVTISDVGARQTDSVASMFRYFFFINFFSVDHQAAHKVSKEHLIILQSISYNMSTFIKGPPS
jgi:hypothetical protein